MSLMKSLSLAFAEVEKILKKDAGGKGYTGLVAGEDGRPTLDFVAQHAPGHPEGEIMYKVLRWRAMRDPKDLLKIMAWAFLLWDSHNRANQGQEVPAKTWSSPAAMDHAMAAGVGCTTQPRRWPRPSPPPATRDFPDRGLGPKPERLLTKRDGRLIFQVIDTLSRVLYPLNVDVRRDLEALKREFESRG